MTLQRYATLPNELANRLKNYFRSKGLKSETRASKTHRQLRDSMGRSEVAETEVWVEV